MGAIFGTIPLEEIENEILSTLQQTELVNFGGVPNWTAATNPEFDQPTTDNAINQGYRRVCRDLSAIDVALFEATFVSTANTYRYPLPPPVTAGNPNPACKELRRLFYTPVGAPYTVEFEPGIRMIPWKEFQRYTAAGYNQVSGFGSQPQFCAVSPDRRYVHFWPGSANAGDTIGIGYACIPTTGSLVPLLSAEGDCMIVPDDFADLVQLYALFKLWPKARAMAAAADSLKLYQDQIEKARADWKHRSGGDKMRFTDVVIDRATSGPFGWG
jgi:hypothetical protein